MLHNMKMMVPEKEAVKIANIQINVVDAYQSKVAWYLWRLVYGWLSLSTSSTSKSMFWLMTLSLKTQLCRKWSLETMVRLSFKQLLIIIQDSEPSSLLQLFSMPSFTSTHVSCSPNGPWTILKQLELVCTMVYSSNLLFLLSLLEYS